MRTTSRGGAPPDELAILGRIFEGTAGSVGEEFFQNLVRHLALAVNTSYAFVAEFAEVNTRARSLAFWARGRIAENIEWELAGTPCEDVVQGSFCHHPTGVSLSFPDDAILVDLKIDSYLGVPLRDPDGVILGHLAVFDERPMPPEPQRLYTFRIFAARAAAELQRLKTEKALAGSEQKHRDLYEEAPIAYLSTDLKGRITSANRRAADWIGYSKQELLGMTLGDLLPDSPEKSRRNAEVLKHLARCEDVEGEEMEFQRRSGEPAWANVWIRPILGRDGRVDGCRTMCVDVTERVKALREKSRLERQNQYLQAEIKAAHNFEEIISKSNALRAVLDSVSRVAATNASVMISGETGTGKELIARVLHSASLRSGKPLIKVNCASLPAGLVESELFGHEKGSFTGAISRRLGRFELADGGTLFLDEVGEISLDVQAKLLRVLQEQEFERLGSTVPIRVDVRIITATNRDLASEVREKRFREDLFYRLNVFPIHVPPLRERREDISLLVYYFLETFAKGIGKSIDRVEEETLTRLQAYSWPGNVRELRNVIERAVILCNGSTLVVGPEQLGSMSRTPTPSGTGGTPSRPLSLVAVEREHMLQVLAQTGWKIEGPRGAATILGLHPNTLRSRLKKLEIARPPHE